MGTTSLTERSGADQRELPERQDAGVHPVDMLLFCPGCGKQHIDGPDEVKDWTNPPHRSHECQGCGHVWRPADVPTNGVAAIRTRGTRDGDAHPRFGCAACLDMMPVPDKLEFPRASADGSSGWKISADYLAKLDNLIGERDFAPSLEGIEQVLLALEEYLSGRDAAINTEDDCRAEDGPLAHLDVLLVKFHRAVWDAAVNGRVGYDLAGVEVAKEIQRYVRDMLRHQHVAARHGPGSLASAHPEITV